MTPGVRPLVAGNWKMNGLSGSLAEIDAMRQAADAGEPGHAELLVCPPATLIAQAAWRIKGGELSLGGQDCYTQPSGAFTVDTITSRIYRQALSREPTPAERKLAGELLADSGRISAAGLSDLLWCIVMLPEFQLIQ